VPSTKARSADDLDRIIDNALVPHRFENARIVIEAMHADTSVPGYSAIVDLRDLDPESETVVRRVLNAGATIGAVLRNRDEPLVYAIRPELYEFLSITGARAFERHGKGVQEDIGEKVRAAEIEKMVYVALLPVDKVQENVEAVLTYTHPINVSKDGFMSEILMNEIAPEHMLTVRGVLNVGAVHNLVQREQGTAGRYEIHGDLYKTLSRIRARMLSGASRAATQLPYDRRTVIDGGKLTETRAQLPPSNTSHADGSTHQIASRLAGRPNEPDLGDFDLTPGQPLDRTPKAIDRARDKQNRFRRAAAEPQPAPETGDPTTIVQYAEPRRLSDLTHEFAEYFISTCGLSREAVMHILNFSHGIDVEALRRGVAAVKT
jgi:hypothetical protein